jgi:hypothetical protein
MSGRRLVMKITVGSYESIIKFPELLRQVKAGKSFTITNLEKLLRISRRVRE